MNCIQQESGKNWVAYHGDCCEVIKGIPDNSVDFGIHSPPFANLYVYSDSEADMGNCQSTEEFIVHYSFLIKEMFRVTVPGRLCAIHVKDLPRYKNRDGESALEEFPDMCVRAFKSLGWSYHSRVTIWKCPVTEREKSNPHGLLHATVKRDSSGLRQGMPDYLVVFRKPPAGDTLLSEKPIERPNGFAEYIGDEQFNPLTSDYHPSNFARTGKPDMVMVHGSDVDGKPEFVADPIQSSICIWRRYAEPVWWDIDPKDVLNNYKIARTSKDENHICPLQLGLIRRAIALWSNPGEVVFTPFGGVGSESVVALQLGRKAVSIELSEPYFNLKCRNLRITESHIDAPRLDLESALPSCDELEEEDTLSEFSL